MLDSQSLHEPHRAKMRKLLNGALKAAGERGANLDNAVAMGYCFGGTAIHAVAHAGKR